MNEMTTSRLCPCNSGKPFSQCCRPVLADPRHADTAESLMRSRYTAYVVGNISHLLATWHLSTRPSAIDPESIPAWRRLEVVRAEKGQPGDSEGLVEFKATAISGKKALKLHEASRFVKEAGQWLYVDGEVFQDSPGTPPIPGRNSPCPCGSGKKFKKCCGI